MELLKLKRSERGFSLAETLVALLMLAFVSTSILAMFSQGIAMNKSGRDVQTLTSLAREKLEDLIALPFRHTDLDPEIPHEEIWGTVDDPQISRVWSVTEYSVSAQNQDGTEDPVSSSFSTPLNGGQGNLKHVRLTVTSHGFFGIGDRSITLEGFIRPDF